MWKCWLHILWETILFFCRCRLMRLRQPTWPRTKQIPIKNLFGSDADYGDYDYPSSTGCGAGGCGGGADGQGFGGIQPRKGGRFFSATIMSIIFPHFEVMGEKGAMWWSTPPSLPCPDKDLVQSVLNLQKQPLRERGIKKGVKIFGFRCLAVFFGTLSQTMGRWGSKVPNSLVKTTIQSFLLQTSRNVPKHAIPGWVGVQSPKQIHGILSKKFLIFSKK